MTDLTLLNLRQASAYQRDELNSIQARLKNLETQEYPFFQIGVIDAKGDLIVGTANDLYDNLTVGTNDQVLMAASGETTGLKWGTITATSITDGIITNAKLANMVEATVKGRAVGAGTGAPVDLTATQLNAIWGSAAAFNASFTVTLGASSDEGRGQMGIPPLKVKGNVILLYRESADNQGANIEILKRRSGTGTVLSSGDQIGSITFTGADGNTFGAVAARILVDLDNTPGSTDMPGRIIFLTSPNGSATPAESFQINSSQNIIVADGKRIETDEIRARDSGGLILKDDGGNYGIFIEDGGQVGINTTSPAAHLHVSATAGASTIEEIARFTVSDDATAYLKITNTTSADNVFGPGIETLHGGTGVSRFDLVKITTDTGTTPALIYDARTAAGAAITTRPLFDWRTFGSSKMIMLADGSVGIGTTAPVRLLHVGGGTDATFQAYEGITANVAGNAQVSARNSTDNVEIGMFAHSSPGGFFGTWTNHDLYFRTNNSTRMTLDAGGNLGVGVTPTGTLSVKAGSSTNSADVGGVLYVTTSSTGNVGTGEDNLASYSVPANTLATDGDSLWFEASGIIASTAASKTVRVEFGTSGTMLVYAGSISGGSSDTWMIRGRIFRTGAATQTSHAMAVWASGSGTLSQVSTALNQTLSGAVTLRVTGEGTNNNDIILRTFIVGWEPNNT